jgi:hypothetical protein
MEVYKNLNKDNKNADVAILFERFDPSIISSNGTGIVDIHDLCFTTPSKKEYTDHSLMWYPMRSNLYLWQKVNSIFNGYVMRYTFGSAVSSGYLDCGGTGSAFYTTLIVESGGRTFGAAIRVPYAVKNYMYSFNHLAEYFLSNDSNIIVDTVDASTMYNRLTNKDDFNWIFELVFGSLFIRHSSVVIKVE